MCLSERHTLIPVCLSGASPVAQLVKNPPATQETLGQFLGQEDPLEKDRLPTSVFLGFPGGSAGEESAHNVGDLGSIPGLGRSPGDGKDYPLQYSGLENSMDCMVHRITKSWTQLSDFHCVSVVLKFWEWGVMELGEFGESYGSPS